MPADVSVYEKTYKYYLSQFNAIDLNAIETKLGVRVQGDEITIPLFNDLYRVTEIGISDPLGEQPSLDICVILYRYLLMCPETNPKEKTWVSYREFKDSGPLTAYFANDVERAIAAYFAGKISQIGKSGKTLGGYPPKIDAAYDLSIQFDALPKIPIVMLYNDADAEFPATCSVLFERRAEKYLDPECTAMLGRLLFTLLKKPNL